MPKRSIFYDDNEDTTLGGRVFQAREAAGLTVSQVINRLGVRKATYLAWEADRSEPGVQSGRPPTPDRWLCGRLVD